MRRITAALLSSRFSIHGLSRCRGEGDERFARFNMPLELGMAIALCEIQHLTGRPRDWAVLVPVGHASIKFVSDLGGYDLLQYDGTVRVLMGELLPWLQERPGATVMAPAVVFDAFSTFQSEKARLAEEGLGRISWANRLIAAFRTVPKL